MATTVTVVEARRTGPRLEPTALSIAVSESGEVAAVGGRDGAGKVLDAAHGEWRSDSDLRPAHVGDINVLRCFPSGRVFLSGAADATLAVWDALSGRRAATLGKGGHTRGVLGAAIVGVGRNVLSCARDGTVRLWEIASQTVIATIADLGSPVNSISLCSAAAGGSPSTASRDPREVATEGKIVVAAVDDRTLRVFDVHSRTEVAVCRCDAPVSACCGGICSDRVYVSGDEVGNVAEWDARRTDSPVRGPFARSSAAITDIQHGPGSTDVWLSSADGQLWLADFGSDVGGMPRIVADLTGHDYEPIRAIAVHSSGRGVLSVTRDGTVRSFFLPPMSP
jgi:proteasomal ATPase-associated factor 1